MSSGGLPGRPAAAPAAIGACCPSRTWRGLLAGQGGRNVSTAVFQPLAAPSSQMRKTGWQSSEQQSADAAKWRQRCCSAAVPALAAVCAVDPPFIEMVTLMHWYRLEGDTGRYNRGFAVHIVVVRGVREGVRCNDLLGKVAAQHAASSLPRTGTSAAAAGCREAILHSGCCWELLELVASAAQSVMAMLLPLGPKAGSCSGNAPWLAGPTAGLLNKRRRGCCRRPAGCPPPQVAAGGGQSPRQPAAADHKTQTARLVG